MIFNLLQYLLTYYNDYSLLITMIYVVLKEMTLALLKLVIIYCFVVCSCLTVTGNYRSISRGKPSS